MERLELSSNAVSHHLFGVNFSVAAAPSISIMTSVILRSFLLQLIIFQLMLELMNKLSKSQKGFTSVEALLIILIAAVIGFGGYYVYHTNHRTKTARGSTSSSTKSTATAKPYSGWLSYCSSYGKLCFKYPQGWQLSKTINTDTSVAPEEEKDIVTSPSGKVQATYVANEYVNCTGNNVTINVLNVSSASNGLNIYSLAELPNDSSEATSNGYNLFYFLGNTGYTAADSASTPFTTGAVIKSSYEPNCYFMHNPAEATGTGLRQSFTVSAVLTQAQTSSTTLNLYPTFADANAWFNSSEVKTAGQILASAYYQ